MCQIQTGLFAEILCLPSLFVLNLTCAIVGRFGEGDPTSGQTIALLWNKVQTADFCYLQKKMFSEMEDTFAIAMAKW